MRSANLIIAYLNEVKKMVLFEEGAVCNIYIKPAPGILLFSGNRILCLVDGHDTSSLNDGEIHVKHVSYVKYVPFVSEERKKRRNRLTFLHD